MDIINELNKISKEVKAFDKDIAEDIHDVIKDFKKIDRRASLINKGDRIVCLNPLQGIYEGRIYLAGDYVEPNFLIVKEEDGRDVGLFRADRFCLYNYED